MCPTRSRTATCTASRSRPGERTPPSLLARRSRAGLLTEIDERFGPHPGFDNDYDGAWYVGQFIDHLAEAQLEGARRRVDIVNWLQEREPDWDLLFTVMSEPHSAGHHMWHGIDPSHPLHKAPTAEQARRRLIEVYHAVDAEIGRLIDSLPADTSVAVFAVHGMQPNANDVPSMVLLPELLHRITFGGRSTAPVAVQRPCTTVPTSCCPTSVTTG